VTTIRAGRVDTGGGGLAFEQQSHAVAFEVPPLQVSAPPRPIRIGPRTIAAASEPHSGYDASKRALDVVGGLFLLLVSLPIVLVAAIAVALTSRGWPFYIQVRTGYLGREFRMLKIRTMRSGADREVPMNLNETGGPTFKSQNDPRITTVGAFLRKTSIDEFPQFLNVVLGQLSLVGPRPGLPSEVRQYTHAEARRLSVKPGLTCIWQVSGRSDVAFRRWMAMDRLYIRRRSLAYDLWLVLLTPWTVITMKGAR
jgi:lipopolysaccharide/colanic/teichoic acid biosynthesis glycosyltransferase